MFAQPLDLHDEALQRGEQRQQQWQKDISPKSDTRLPSPTLQQAPKSLEALDESCFPIDDILLIGEESSRFQFALKSAKSQLTFKPGQCLGSKAVNALMVTAQNALLEAGYSTTRIVAGAQNLKSRKLVLTVIPGRIHAIRFNEENSEETHVARISGWRNQFPFTK